MLGKRWTEEEREFIKKHYASISSKEIGALLGRTPSSVRTQASWMGLIMTPKQRADIIKKYDHRKYRHNNQYFDVPKLENSYWAGFLAADGAILRNGKTGWIVRLGLSEKDEQHVRAFMDSICYNGKLARDGHGMSYVAISSSDDIVHSLDKNFGVIPRKTFVLAPPEKLDYMCSLAYIVGYCDGDGCITKAAGYTVIEFEVAAEKVLHWVKSIFDKIAPNGVHGLAKVRKRNNRPSNNYIYSLKGARAEKVIKKLLSFKVPRLRRKWEKVVNRLGLDYDYYSF